MSARNRQHNYPSLLTRVLRARERGIRETLAGRNALNPYWLGGSGTPLWEAWQWGNWFVRRLHEIDMCIPNLADREPVDLSHEFTDVCREIEATVPCGWPRDRQTRAAA